MATYDEPHKLLATSFTGENVGEVTVKTHRESECEGEFCPLHKPSKHALSERPMMFRADVHGLIERICEHGVGHPDPDSLWYFENIAQLGDLGVHGCDGCCGPILSEEW